MKPLKSIFAACFIIIINIVTAESPAQPASDIKEPLYPGSQKKAENIIASSDVIFVGQITAISGVFMLEPGASYCLYKVKVVTVLKGAVGGLIQVSASVRSDGPVAEVRPRANETYIFFAKLGRDQVDAVKLLPATDTNIANVKTLIAAAPASK